MKQYENIFLLIIVILIFGVRSERLNLEEFLMNNNKNENTFGSESAPDPDDVIYKMKNFFDTYTENLKNSVKSVDKLYLPNNSTTDENAVYVSEFDPNSLKRLSQNIVEENNQMREKDLRNIREDKQIVEEKNIDMQTKNKILNSRTNIASSERNKLMNDYGEKNNRKNALESDVKSLKSKLDNLSSDSNSKITQIKMNIKKYDDVINNIPSILNEKVFEDELKIQNQLEKLGTEIFKSAFESDFYMNHNQTKIDFIIKADTLNKIFANGLNQIKTKNLNLENSIRNKTGIIDKIKKEIEEKYNIFEKMNNTISKLHLIQADYSKALRNADENLNLMKSKKRIILDNIEEKKKQRKIKKITIEKVLDDLEKELDKYNVDNLSVNKYRKDISSVNNRIRNLIVKENMIFKKNKIKI
jgi:hypothetical protein